VKYALITDIHGNLAALEQVLKKVDSEHCDKIICLGDVVGYGPFPNECLAQVKKRVDGVIVGNHDAAAIAMTDTSDFNENAKKALIWTRRQLTPENRDYVRTFSTTWDENGALFVHASPKEPTLWHYILTDKDVMDASLFFDHRVCFFGHTHYPIAYYFDPLLPDFTFLRESTIVFKDQGRYLVNVGSVGQPRDRNPQAAFGLFDTAEGTYRHVRVDYDIKKTQAAMEMQRLPRFLIQRLQSGW